jgi:hypothetical protein
LLYLPDEEQRKACVEFFSVSTFFLAGYDSEGEKLMKQLGIDEQLASLTSVPPTKSALDIWHVGD